MGWEGRGRSSCRSVLFWAGKVSKEVGAEGLVKYWVE